MMGPAAQLMFYWHGTAYPYDGGTFPLSSTKDSRIPSPSSNVSVARYRVRKSARFSLQFIETGCIFERRDTVDAHSGFHNECVPRRSGGTSQSKKVISVPGDPAPSA